jgi:hypothetical protein
MAQSIRYISRALLCVCFIFLLSYSLSSRQAYQKVGRGSSDTFLGTKNPKFTKGFSANVHLTKRQTTTPQAGPELWMLATRTWMGFEPEPENSGWTKATVRAEVQKFYDKIERNIGFRQNEATIVSGLWIPCSGIFFGTIPHTDDEVSENVRPDINYSFGRYAQIYAKCLWDTIGGRKTLGSSTTLYHAEDMACYVFEYCKKFFDREELEADELYPEGSYITSYGKYSVQDTASIKEACGQGDPQGLSAQPQGAKIDPACTESMTEMGVDVVND